jgi:hypothetical protein
MQHDEPSRHLVARIREALAEDSRTNVLDVQVMVSSGRVFLMGAVANEERRRVVLEVAREQLPSNLELVNEIWIQNFKEPTEPEQLG